MRKMEEDADQVLRYMASNGLVANATKTSFLMLNHKRPAKELSLKIGEAKVVREKSATLLGLKYQDDQMWEEQIFGKGGLLSALNSRMYIVRRLKSHLSTKALTKIVDGIFTSKIRYGLQLYRKVRTRKEDPTCEAFNRIQLVQTTCYGY